MKFVIRAGSDLFFISMKFSYFSFLKLALRVLVYNFGLLIPELLRYFIPAT
jgi:hypothetical protein